MSKAVLFDMDGVLIDSEGVMLKAAAAGMKAFGIEAAPEDFIPYIGMEAEKYFGSVMEKYGKHYTDEVKVHTYTVYGRIITPEYVCPYAPEILHTLRKSGIPFAICSGAVRQKIGHNLKALGLTEQELPAVISGDDVTHNKPDPEIYLKGAKAIGIEAKDCIVVEDSLGGIRAGKASGAKTVGVGTTLTEADFAKEGNADYFIKSLAELPAILIENGINI
ncbi:MAG: HAD family phosphatase [Ruminococcaceae bacterium]|nr:HAD family phosphatase [Oscillospiraceae bacterium]